MSQVTIKIKTDNAAFEGESFGHEVARILLRAGTVMMESNSIPIVWDLRDINGNIVGTLVVS